MLCYNANGILFDVRNLKKYTFSEKREIQMPNIDEKKSRETNLELLRIISMVLIVMSHSDDWGDWQKHMKRMYVSTNLLRTGFIWVGR